MGATESALKEVPKGLALAVIVGSLVMIVSGCSDEARCEEISADVDAGRYPVSGWETDEGATETELEWWIDNC